jgi:hypothetical protein
MRLEINLVAITICIEQQNVPLACTLLSHLHELHKWCDSGANRNHNNIVMSFLYKLELTFNNIPHSYMPKLSLQANIMSKPTQMNPIINIVFMNPKQNLNDLLFFVVPYLCDRIFPWDNRCTSLDKIVER